MMNKNRFAMFYFISSWLILMMTTSSFSQVIDWNEKFIQERNSDDSRVRSDNGLPGVRKNPLAPRKSRKFCTENTLGELFSGDFLRSRCPRKPLTVFEIETDFPR